MKKVSIVIIILITLFFYECKKEASIDYDEISFVLRKYIKSNNDYDDYNIETLSIDSLIAIPKYKYLENVIETQEYLVKLNDALGVEEHNKKFNIDSLKDEYKAVKKIITYYNCYFKIKKEKFDYVKRNQIWLDENYKIIK